MSRSTLTTAASVLFLFIAPAAGASWMSYGTYEPDTSYDEGFMFDEPPGTLAKTNIYFNAFPKSMDVTNGANGAWINPNVGALQTRIDAPGQMSFQALLGVWTDCNGDGYIGMLETAVREYKSEALLNRAVCPPVVDVVGIAPATNWETKGAHNNYNGWVTELIPIAGPDSTGSDSRVYPDAEAMVWGDSRQPGADWPDAAPACSARPSRTDDGTRSETRTTGGLLRWIDCRGDRSVNAGGSRSVSVIASFNDADSAAGTGLGFGDPENAHRSASPLNVATFGSEDSSRSAVRAQDCDKAPLAGTGDVPVGSDADNIPLARPVPSDPVNDDVNSWTIPGTLNYTRESITVAPKAGGGSDTAGDCNFANDRYHENGGDFYGAIEANPAVGFENGKRNAQWNFFFFSGQRGSLPSNAVRGGTAGASQDLGVEALGTECRASSCAISQWDGGRITHTAPVTRGTLADGSVNGDETTVADAPHWSFYAHVGEATTGRGFALPGGGGTYGSDQCGSETAGEFHGWNCDVTDWYKLADGSYTQIPLLGAPNRGFRPLAKVGQAYEFRDVDCLDGSLGSTGVGISPAFYGNSKCA